MKDTALIAITGGIGAGKSVVSSILRNLGYPVYDTDSEAKGLMIDSDEIKGLIRQKITPDAVNPDGTINRPLLADIVFNNPVKLEALNSIVHSAVLADVERFRLSTNSEIAFVETAILYQSNLDKMVRQVWDVTAPEDVRIRRVIKRNSTTEQEVRSRMESQKFTPVNEHPDVNIIINDDSTALIPQIEALLNSSGVSCRSSLGDGNQAPEPV